MLRLILIGSLAFFAGACKPRRDKTESEAKQVTLSNENDIFLIQAKVRPPRSVDDLVIYLCDKEKATSSQACIASVDQAEATHRATIRARYESEMADDPAVKDCVKGGGRREKCLDAALQGLADVTFKHRFIQETKYSLTEEDFDREFIFRAERDHLQVDLKATVDKLLQLAAQNENIVLRDKEKLREAFGDAAEPLAFALGVNEFREKKDFPIPEMQCQRSIYIGPARVAYGDKGEVAPPYTKYEYTCVQPRGTWTRTCKADYDQTASKEGDNARFEIVETSNGEAFGVPMAFSRQVQAQTVTVLDDEAAMDQASSDYMNGPCRGTEAKEAMAGKFDKNGCAFSVAMSDAKTIATIYASCDFQTKTVKEKACFLKWESGATTFAVESGRSTSNNVLIPSGKTPLDAIFDYLAKAKTCR